MMTENLRSYLKAGKRKNKVSSKIKNVVVLQGELEKITEND